MFNLWTTDIQCNQTIRYSDSAENIKYKAPPKNAPASTKPINSTQNFIFEMNFPAFSKKRTNFELGSVIDDIASIPSVLV